MPVLSDRSRTTQTASRAERASLLLPVLAAVVACSGLSALQRLDWRFELLAHWRIHYAVVAAILAVILMWQRRYRFAVVGILVCASQAPAWLPLLSRIEPDTRANSRSAARLRMVAFNVHAGNFDYGPTIDWLRAADADLAVLVELTSDWERALQDLRDTFPFHYSTPGLRDGDGIGAWSKYPLNNGRAWHPGGGKKQSIQVDVRVASGTFTLIAVHPRPPVQSTWASERQRYLSEVARFVAQQRLAVIAAGDFNMTPNSHLYDDFLRSSGLVGPREWTPTWPAILYPFGIPVDHVFAGMGAEIVRIATGPHLGSDHRPIIAELLLGNAR